MAFYLNYNGTGFVTAPTLGNTLLLDSLEIESDYVLLNAAAGFHYIYSQAANFTTTRELALCITTDASPLLIVYLGGGSQQTLGAVSDLFGSTTIEGKLTWSINYATAQCSVLLDDVHVAGSPFSVVIGGSRNSGVLFRIGARATNTTVGSTASSTVLPAGSRIGDTRVTINGMLSRSYVSDGVGSTWEEITGGNTGTLSGFPTDGSQWGVYGGGGGGVTVDAGGVSSFNISAQGVSAVAMGSGAVSAVVVTGVGGARVARNAGGVSSLSVVATGGAAATMAAGGASEFTIISTGGAVVENDITGGGLSSFSISGQGGATVTRNAGGIAYFSVAAGGGASVGVAAGGATEFNIVAAGGVSAILSAGGVSSFNVSGQGGAAVNEQAIVINRVTFASAAMPQAVTLSTIPVLESTIIPVQFNYRRVL